MSTHPEVIKQLKAYMAKEKINQTQLACRLGVASGQINRWLKKGNLSGVWIQLLKAKRIIR